MSSRAALGLAGGPPYTGSTGRSTLQYPAALINYHTPIGSDVREGLLRPARPLHLNGRGCFCSEPEGQRQVALRTVAGPAADHLPLLSGTHDCADAVAIRLTANQSHADPVIAVAAVVSIEVCGSVIGRNEKIE